MAVFFCSSDDGCLAGIIKTCGANDHLDAVFGAVLNMLQRPLGAGEVDQEFRLRQAFGKIGFDRHAGWLA